MLLLADVVATADALTATRSRSAKISLVADLLRRAAVDDLRAVVGLLIAAPRQGRLGVGWRSIRSRAAAHAEVATLTVGDVDAAFERLAGLAGDGVGARRAAELDALAASATAVEWDFLVRVILGELRTGALQGVVVDAIAAAADRSLAAVRRAAMLTGDLGETAVIALSGNASDLDAVALEVGRPVLPMLAGSAQTVLEALAATGPAVVEYKLDGARIQVHRRGEDVRVYTRGLADITHRVPEIVEAVRAMPVDDAILDGETLALDEDGGPRPFQDTMARFGSEAAAQIALRPWFFDVLRVDGRDLLDEPLTTRRDTLARVAGPWCVPGVVTDDDDIAARFSEEALAAGHPRPRGRALVRPRPRHRRRRCRRPLLRGGARRGARRRRREGGRQSVLRRAAGLGLDQGQARHHPRPRCARDRMGIGPPRRHAVEPAPGCARR